jgi:glucokinase
LPVNNQVNFKLFLEMELKKEKPVVMTLDAGGTNFVFCALRGDAEVVNPYVLPSSGHDLEQCLNNIIDGFKHIQSQLDEKPVAISFAFPGPADYVNGIIGDLGNLTGFRGGVALGPMLEEHFNLPVFINNDGDLFSYGEAIYGMLPRINKALKDAGSMKQYRNLIGVTLGTGFGGGLVHDNELYIGDNGAGAEVWLLRNPLHEGTFAEESISIRAITGHYSKLTQAVTVDITPFDIYKIAMGEMPGSREAAKEAFRLFGKAIGMALAEVVTVFDSLVVVGGGLANAYPLFFPAMLEEMNGTIATLKGDSTSRLVMKVYDLENEDSFAEFSKGKATQIKVPFSDSVISFDPEKRVGVGISKLGASKAISLGAYAFALRELGYFNNH